MRLALDRLRLRSQLTIVSVMWEWCLILEVGGQDHRFISCKQYLGYCSHGCAQVIFTSKNPVCLKRRTLFLWNQELSSDALWFMLCVSTRADLGSYARVPVVSGRPLPSQLGCLLSKVQMSNGRVELPYLEDLGLFLTSVDKDSEDTQGLILSSARWPLFLFAVCVCMCTHICM